MSFDIGERAPDFTLPDTEGEGWSLAGDGTAATVLVFTCNHCPYALAWHDRIADADYIIYFNVVEYRKILDTVYPYGELFVIVKGSPQQLTCIVIASAEMRLDRGHDIRECTFGQ